MSWEIYKQKKGQVTIESTIAFIGCIVLIVGCFNIFLWLAYNIRDRHIAYEKGRIFNQEIVKREIEEDKLIEEKTRQIRLYPWSEGFYKASRLYVFDRENPRLYRDISCPGCKDSRSTSEVELRIERK